MVNSIWFTEIYSETSMIRTPLGPLFTVLFIEVFLCISEVLYVHMSVQGVSNGAEQWCPVKGGGCILGCPLLDVSLNLQTKDSLGMTYYILLHL